MTKTQQAYEEMRETVRDLQAKLILTARDEFVAGTRVKWKVHTTGSPDGYLRGEVLPHKESLQKSCLIAVRRSDTESKKPPVAFIDAYQLFVDDESTTT